MSSSRSIKAIFSIAAVATLIIITFFFLSAQPDETRVSDDDEFTDDNTISSSTSSSSSSRISSRNDNNPKTAIKTHSSRSSSSSSSYPDEKQLYNSIRDPTKRNHPNNQNSYLQPAPSSCDQPYGSAHCRSATIPQNNLQTQTNNNYNNGTTMIKKKPSCCCCCWQPHLGSCVGHFKNASQTFLRNHIEKTGFFHRGMANKSCPWYDRGFWPKPLPDNFLDLPIDSARRIANERVCACPGRKRAHARSDGIGLMYMYKLAKQMATLRPMPATSSLASKDKNGTGLLTMSASAKRTNMRTTTKNAPGGILTFAGDSVTRQLFSRMVHRIRSRECSDQAEKRRSGVFELQIHETAVYVATTLGDAFTLSQSCEEGLDFLSSTLSRTPFSAAANKSKSSGNYTDNNNINSNITRQPRLRMKHKILFQACFVWDNTPSALLGTLANLHQLKDRVAALVFFPQMWYCGSQAEFLCMNANQSNGAALAVIGTAVHYSIPRTVICTNVIRQTFGYYQLKRIKRRNQQLRQLFPFKPHPRHFPWVRTMMLEKDSHENDEPEVENHHRNNDGIKGKGGAAAAAAATTMKNYDPSLPASPPYIWPNVRLYDFSNRHNLLAPEQCDVVHGMCMFLPARKEATKAAVTSLFGGPMCPSPGFGLCQDMGNYHLLDEIMTTVKI